MPITEARIARLRGFGLSEYAARAYLALLDLGVGEARDVSALSKVPSSKIYGVLDQLHARGLVDIRPEFPKRYAPVPFDDFLAKVKREHEEAAQAIEREREELLESFAVQGDVRLSDRGGFALVRGRPNVLERIAEAVDRAEEDVLIVATRRQGARLGPVRAALARARSRGVAIRVLLPPDGVTDGFADLAEVRTSEQDGPEGSSLVVVDSARAVLVSFVPDDDSALRGKDVAAVTDQAAFAGLLAAMGRPRWEAAKTMEKRTARV